MRVLWLAISALFVFLPALEATPYAQVRNLTSINTNQLTFNFDTVDDLPYSMSLSYGDGFSQDSSTSFSFDQSSSYFDMGLTISYDDTDFFDESGWSADIISFTMSVDQVEDSGHVRAGISYLKTSTLFDVYFGSTGYIYIDNGFGVGPTNTGYAYAVNHDYSFQIYVDWQSDTPISTILVANETHPTPEYVGTVEAGCTFHCTYFSDLFFYSEDTSSVVTVKNLVLSNVGEMTVTLDTSIAGDRIVYSLGNYSDPPSAPSCPSNYKTLPPSPQTLALNQSSSFYMRSCGNGTASSSVLSQNFQLTANTPNFTTLSTYAFDAQSYSLRKVASSGLVGLESLTVQLSSDDAAPLSFPVFSKNSPRTLNCSSTPSNPLSNNSLSVELTASTALFARSCEGWRELSPPVLSDSYKVQVPPPHIRLDKPLPYKLYIDEACLHLSSMSEEAYIVYTLGDGTHQAPSCRMKASSADSFSDPFVGIIESSQSSGNSSTDGAGSSGNGLTPSGRVCLSDHTAIKAIVCKQGNSASTSVSHAFLIMDVFYVVMLVFSVLACVVLFFLALFRGSLWLGKRGAVGLKNVFSRDNKIKLVGEEASEEEEGVALIGKERSVEEGLTIEEEEEEEEEEGEQQQQQKGGDIEMVASTNSPMERSDLDSLATELTASEGKEGLFSVL